MSKVVTYFSNGNTFGLDRNNRISGFNGIDQADLKSTAHLAVVPTVLSGGVLAAHTTQVMSHSIRIKDKAGTNYYVMCTATTTNRTGGG